MRNPEPAQACASEVLARILAIQRGSRGPRPAPRLFETRSFTILNYGTLLLIVRKWVNSTKIALMRWQILSL